MNSLRFSTAVVVSIAVFSANNVFAFDWKDLWQRPDQRAYELLQGGDSTLAAETFEDPQWRGVSRYRAGEFEQAQEEFARMEGDTALYNQGVTAVQQGSFDTAIEKFEELVERSPEHADGQHNLEVARELAKQQEQQGDQDQPQESGDQQQENKDQQDQSGSEGEGQSQQAEGDSEGKPGDSDRDDEQRGGELAAEPDDAKSDSQAPESDEDSPAGQQSPGQQDPEQQEQQQSGGESEPQGDGEDQQAQSAALGEAGPSESEQATEQWLRRIPDDPSQLLRNKIKLNHMIEHADVQDMREPW